MQGIPLIATSGPEHRQTFDRVANRLLLNLERRGAQEFNGAETRCQEDKTSARLRSPVLVSSSGFENAAPGAKTWRQSEDTAPPKQVFDTGLSERIPPGCIWGNGSDALSKVEMPGEYLTKAHSAGKIRSAAVSCYWIGARLPWQYQSLRAEHS